MVDRPEGRSFLFWIENRVIMNYFLSLPRLNVTLWKKL